MRACIVPTLAALALLLAAGRAAANPLDAFGWGARAPALGNAYSAVGDDSAAGYYNPAGLARSQDLRIDIGYQAAQPLIDVSGKRQSIRPSRGLAAGIALPGHIKSFRFAFGVTLFLPDQYVTRIHVLGYDVPRLQMYDSRTQRFYLAANLAVRLYRGLYLGGGLAFMSRSAGTVELRGNIAVSDANASMLQSSVAVDLLAIRYPQFGLLWEVSPKLALSLVYRHSFRLDLQQAFTINADIGDPGQTPVVKGAKLSEDSQSVDLFQPWQIVAGGAARFGRLLVSFDLTFARWSEQPVPASAFTLKIDVGQLGDLVKLPPPRTYPDPGFHDLLIPAVGLEWRALDGAAGDRLALDVRAGYRYEASPIPAQLGDSSFGDADKHILSGGLGLTLRKLGRVLLQPLAIDGFAAVTVLPERDFYKLDPRSAVGDFTVKGLVWQAGGQTRWRF
jgi:long-chain fatty acid transport protein